MPAHPSAADRRSFLASGAVAAAGLAASAAPRAHAADAAAPAAPAASPRFRISLAEWSIHNALFKKELDNLDFPAYAREVCDVDGIEYVNAFFKDKAQDEKYLAELKKRCSDHGVESLLIMCDAEGQLGDPDDAKRTQTVENHKKWVEAAKYLGCHSIRVNAQSSGSREEQAKLAADGLARLSEFAAGLGINVIVENHGGLSSDGAWLSGVLAAVGKPNCGSLPDFGNFYEYDRYQGVTDLMPFAKAVSAKSHVFDIHGIETEIDYFRMMKIVADAGYKGWIGIEWEGKTPDELSGILLTKRLIERAVAKLDG
ncbi:MAG: sugar phosphate isomerase/epimerase [Pirellulales bacterium]|nr:sugar phosphate isomerase/epimerase [Pirellulales bacterium]